MDSISLVDDLHRLLELMLQQEYGDWMNKSNPSEINDIDDKCCKLASKDYLIDILNNTQGELCAHYPPSIIIPRLSSVHGSPIQHLTNMIIQARSARCRTRFVIPAFIFNGKNICRSSTLSIAMEAYGRQFIDAAGFSNAVSQESLSASENASSLRIQEGRSMFTRLRDDDCKLAEYFGVKYICDFMLEYRKMKYLVPVTSSEKADSHPRYNQFSILLLPYPGSEFFRVWRDNDYQMNGLVFDWSQPAVEVELKPELFSSVRMVSQVEWNDYKIWDLKTLTKNYLKLLLGVLHEGDGGLLLHCVSGWDRTPLFISLLRCLLWADELAHWRLSPEQMLYHTLAYDWFLFGHKLPTRMSTGENVLRFAFQFLAEIVNEDDLSLRKVYDITINPNDSPADNSAQSYVALTWLPNWLETRRQRLRTLSDTFLTLWKDVTTRNQTPEAVVIGESPMPASDGIIATDTGTDNADECD